MDKLDSNTINFCSLSTHNSLINNSNYNFPINTLFEKSSLLLNTEGLVQKSYKVLTPLSLNRNSEDFFKMLLKLNLKQKVLTNKWLNLEMPFLKNVNSLRPSFYLNFLSLKEFQHKIYFSCFTSVVSNFYQTDIISQNSEVMLNCTLFFKNKSNFL